MRNDQEKEQVDVQGQHRREHVAGRIHFRPRESGFEHLFDWYATDAWGGRHPMDRPVVVVTHSVPDGWPREGASFTFVTEGIETAIETAKEMAGDKVVGVNGGTIARQCLNAGLLDEIWVELVPVLLGGGTPFLDQLANAPVVLDGPTVVEGKRVTHLRYQVRR